MKILAIDTSTMTTTVALGEEGKILGEFSVSGSVSHSERVMEMLENLFEKMPFSVRDVDLFVAGRGPGSFTGLRIGITIVKTLAQALEKEAMGISTLRALARGVHQGGLLVPILDARRHRVYTGAYRWEGGALKNIHPDTVIPWEEWEELLREEGATVFGPGLLTFQREVEESPGLLAYPYASQVQARELVQLAWEDYRQGLRQDLFSLTPNYVKKSQAERELEGEEP